MYSPAAVYTPDSIITFSSYVLAHPVILVLAVTAVVLFVLLVIMLIRVLVLLKQGKENQAALLNQQEISERDMAVISGLSGDFSCVVYVDCETDREVHYRSDPMFADHIPGWEEINYFDARMKKLIGTIMHPDDREAFRAATRKETVLAELEKNPVYFVNFRTLCRPLSAGRKTPRGRPERYGCLV